jgi:tetratricopeptide (TPR) repeat protein
MLSNIELKKRVDKITNKLKAGLFDEVILDTKALLKKTKHPILFNILSIAFQSKGEFDNSVKIMKNALELNSRNVLHMNNIAISYHKLDKFEDAEKYFLRGLELDPNYINILNNIGNLKKDLNLIDEAINYYKKALTIEDNILETHFNLASIYQSLGEFEKSKEHLKKTLEINPNFFEADRVLSLVTKYNENNEHFKTMLKKVSDSKLNNINLHHLHFGLGKCYEDIKDYKNAFFHYDKGNSIKKKITNYNIQEDIKKFENIKNIFKNYENIKIKKNKRKIIFILGMPRSGTSLTEQILSSHRNVFGGGELPFISSIINKNFLQDENIKNFNEINDLENKLSSSQDQYLTLASSLDNSEKSFTDKTPLNFRYIGFLINIFPDLKIINCKRNPVDTCWSNFKNYFAGQINFSNNLEDLSEYYNQYESIIKFWKKYFSDSIYDLNYENLVNNSETEIKNLIKFCELSWDPNCLKHHENKRMIKTVSFNQARKPIYQSAIKSSNVYEKYLDKLVKNFNF